MHVQHCLHPVTIKDQYTGEPLIVPCGRCEACLSARSRNLITRLEAEKECWKHCFFFTLTYSDDHLPKLKVLGDGYCTDVSPKRVHPILGAKLFNRYEGYKKLGITLEEQKVSEEFIKRCLEHYGGLPYLCSLDVQRFIKRLRVNIERTYFRQNVKIGYDEQVPKIRYFVCGELGETCLRPHYHGILFFNSDWLAENIQQFVATSWQLGIVDSSYVWGKAINYVAKYCNAYSHIPAVYKVVEIRPFALYSKHPALGTLQADTSVQKKLFLEKSLYQILPKDGGQTIVPLLRSLQDKLYPRLTAFSKFTSYGLYILYNTPSKYEDFLGFRKAIEKNRCTVVMSYLSLIKDLPRGEYNNKLFRWFSLSHRVSKQAAVWNISVRQYVNIIIEYYKLLDYEKLSKWYEFSEEYTKEHSVSDLFTFDNLFAKHLLSLACSVDELDATEIYYLLSFGVDLNDWFNMDERQRTAYRMRYSLEKSEEYLQFKAETLHYYDKSCKTKRKNDYLEAHPDLFKMFHDLKF